MTDEPKPEIDMKEEEKKIAEAKAKEMPSKEKEVRDKAPTLAETKAKEEAKPKEKKKPIQKKPVVKKTEAVVNAVNFPLSTKDSAAICKFIKKKKIEKAISDLEQVLIFKKAVPMKGEIPHRKGKGMMSGRYPKKATEHFIKLLKNLSANASVNGLENPIVIEAVANIASRPFGRFGRVRRKRTHIKIKCAEKKPAKKKKK